MKENNEVQIIEINGLKITGTKEQNEKYSSDERAYDYIKNKIDKLVRYAKQNTKEGINVNIARISGGKHFVLVTEDSGKDNEEKITQMFVHDSKTKSIMDNINIDELEIIKEEAYNVVAISQIKSIKSNVAIGNRLEEIERKYYERLNKQKDEMVYSPIPLDSSMQSLKTKRGFYVGDPSLALKDDILKNGVKTEKVIHTGIYQNF